MKPCLFIFPCRVMPPYTASLSVRSTDAPWPAAGIRFIVVWLSAMPPPRANLPADTRTRHCFEYCLSQVYSLLHAHARAHRLHPGSLVANLPKRWLFHSGQAPVQAHHLPTRYLHHHDDGRFPGNTRFACVFAWPLWLILRTRPHPSFSCRIPGSRGGVTSICFLAVFSFRAG